MRVLLDTNVLIDVIVAREPFLADSARVWALIESKQVEGLVSATSFTTVYYIVRRLRSRAVADKALNAMRSLFTIAACDATVIDRAVTSDFEDFEDAVQYFSALNAAAEYIVTRDSHHFSQSEIPVLAPVEFLAMILNQ